MAKPWKRHCATFWNRSSRTIPHDRLRALIRQRIVDGSVLAVLEQGLKAGVLEELKGWQPTERGTPQGAVVSPLLANVYLNPLDHQVVQQGWAMTRDTDDFIIQCRSQAEAQAALEAVRQWVEAEGLQLHPTKTRIVNTTAEGFDFLGWHFRGGKKRPGYGLSEADHRKWPNRWFAAPGLFSLEHGSCAYG